MELRAPNHSGLEWMRSGVLRLNDKPGLGIEMNVEFLKANQLE